jgi:hypothetical protein
MVKGKKPHARRPKPFLSAALFCTKVLERGDGVMSAINIIDTYTALLLPNALAHPDQRIPVSLTALLALKSGDVVGDRTLQLVLRIPTGKKKVVLEKVLPFKGGEQGVNIKVNIDLKVKTQGLSWIDVIVEGARLTRMPLKIAFEQIEEMKPLHSESS